MSQGNVIANAQVAVGANLSGFNAAMDQLKGKSKKSVQDAMDAIQDEIQRAKLQINLGTGVPGQAQNVQMLADYVKKLGDQLDLVKAKAVGMAQSMGGVGQAIGKVNMAANGSAGGMRNFGYGVLMVSQAIEDAQYGFSAIVNNIPGIAMAFGAPAGLAGALSIAAIAVNQLIKHWDALSAAFNMGKVKTQAEEMEELRKKTSLTADEAERLQRAQALPDKVKDLREAKTEEQKKSDEAITKAIVEAGSRNVASGILATDPALVDSQGDATKVAKQKQELLDRRANLAKVAESSADPDAAYSASVLMADVDKKLIQAERDLVDARKKTAEELASTGTLSKLFPGGPQQLRDLVDKGLAQDPGRFGPKGRIFGAQIDAASPDSIADAKSQEQTKKFKEAERKAAEQENERQTRDEEEANAKARKRTDDARKAIEKAAEHDPIGLNKGEAGRLQREHAEASKDEWETYNKGASRRAEDREFMTPNARRAAEIQEEDRRRSATSRTDQSKDYQDKQLEKRAATAGRGMEDKLRYDILGSVAKGQAVNKDQLQGKVAQHMQASGNYTAEDIKELAPKIVEDLMNKTTGQVQDRANREGVSNRQAAQEEVAKKVGENRKERGQGGFTGLTDFYKKLQSLQDAKDPYQALIEGHSKRTADAIEQVLKEITIRRKKDGGGLVGPA